MKKIFLFLAFILFTHNVFSQPNTETNESASELILNARTYLQKNDFSNAILVYNQAIQIEPKNLIYRRELAHAYYLQGDMMRAERMIAPLLKADEADEETYLVASQIYTRMKQMDLAKNALNKGLDKFPTAGILYASKGDLYTTMKRYKDASEVWEKGIEKAPSYYLNYYKLVKVYFFTKKYLWAIVYGETFVNLESFTSRTEEVKKIMFESYKFLIAELNNQALDGKLNRYTNPTTFEKSSMLIYDNLRNILTGGADIDNIIILRTRFLLEWNKNYANQYPLKMYDFQQLLLQKGLYDCYNQWLFGRNDNEAQLKSWTQQHATTMNQFDSFFRNQKLNPIINQYYKSN
jgi:tetratricopeptide (TPR) repeat protein